MNWLLSYEQYQNRLNPWLNPRVHLAHSLPVRFPVFRSRVIEEVTLICVGMLVAVAMGLMTKGAFATLDFVFKGSFGNLFSSDTLHFLRWWLLLGLLFALVVRCTMPLLGKLASRPAIAVFGACIAGALLLLAQASVTLMRNSPGYRATSFYPSSMEVFIYVLMAWLFSRKLLDYYESAKSQ